MKKSFSKQISYYNKPATITVNVRFDDECNNGHDTFSITGSINRKGPFGCIHNEIKEYFPELAKYIKWHLTSTDGPIHYVSNTIYWAKENNLDYARNSAVWPDATIDQLLNKDLLLQRLPYLLYDFLADMKELFK